MLSRLGFIACVAPLFACAGPAISPASSQAEINASAPASDLAERVRTVFAESASVGRFSGSVLVFEHGQVRLRTSFGHRGLPGSAPNTPDTIFRIGSMTKQFTAAAILALAEEGRLSLDDEVAKFFPAYPRKHLTFDGVEPTLRDLLHHTSGIPELQETQYFRDNAWRRPFDRAGVVGALSAKPLVTKPGTKFAYSNAGYTLLSYVIDDASGVGCEEYLARRFFAPLAMRHTGVHLDTGPIAKGVTYNPYVTGDGMMPGIFTDDPMFGDPDLTLARGAGNVFSTVDDLLIWDRALAGGTSLREDSMKELFTATPASAGYALGWVVSETGGVNTAFHNGAIEPVGFNSAMLRVPARDTFIVYLSNVDLPYADPTDFLLEKLAFGATPPVFVRLPDTELQPYVGRYARSDSVVYEVRIGGPKAAPTLFFTDPSRGELALETYDHRTFGLDGFVTVTFDGENEPGDVPGLTARYRSVTHQASKQR